jgi:hypothetical protein
LIKLSTRTKELPFLRGLPVKISIFIASSQHNIFNKPKVKLLSGCVKLKKTFHTSRKVCFSSAKQAVIFLIKRLDFHPILRYNALKVTRIVIGRQSTGVEI